MRPLHWLKTTAMVGVLAVGCGDDPTTAPSSSPAPTALEARQALAPAGRLRVALQLANPLNVVQDTASGLMTGVAFDLGRELAQRLGVAFEPVFYPSVGALLDPSQSG